MQLTAAGESTEAGATSPGQTAEITSGTSPDQTAALPAVQDGIVRWVTVPDLPQPLAVFDSVFWEPDDTLSLRQWIRTGEQVRGRDVLEIGTGTGLVSLCCLQAGAARVVATDINPAAVRNAEFNAQRLQLQERLSCRLVPRRSPGAWTVLAADEKFDLIISNPPWENQTPVTVAEFALYDPDFALLQSLLQGARQRLKPGGRMLLAYGCVTAIRRMQELAQQLGLQLTILDERDLETLPEVFLPGMLLEVRP